MSLHQKSRGTGNRYSFATFMADRGTNRNRGNKKLGLEVLEPRTLLATGALQWPAAGEPPAETGELPIAQVSLSPAGAKAGLGEFSGTADSSTTTAAQENTLPGGASTLPHGLTIITHGFMLTGTRDAWLNNLADEIILHAGGGNRIDLDFDTTQITHGGPATLVPGGETVVVYDWASKSNNTILTGGEAEPGWREAAGDLLANWLLFTGLVQAATAIDVPIHFIAHSFGTVVISEAIRRLGVYGIQVDQMTTLDPHDQDQTGIPDASNDPQVIVWSNVTFADNYWEDNAGDPNNRYDNSQEEILLPVGHAVVSAANRDLTQETAAINSSEMDYAPHSRIHSWYYKTINGNEEPSGYPEIAGRGWYPNVGVLQHGFALTDPANRTRVDLARLDMTAVAGSKPTSQLSTAETVFNGDFRFWSYDPISYDLPGYDDSNNSWLVNTGDTQHGYAADITFTDQSFKHRPVWLPSRATTLQFDYNVRSGGSGDLLQFFFDGIADPIYVQNISGAAPGWHTATVTIPPSLRGTATAFTVEVSDPSWFPMNSDVWIDNMVVVPPAALLWDGGGTDNRWSTAANWVGDVAPSPGDDLVFPAGAARSNNVNDFSSSTLFGSIVVSGGNYHIQSNSLKSATVEVRNNSELTVRSIVCDSLIIGSSSAAVANAQSQEGEDDQTPIAGMVQSREPDLHGDRTDDAWCLAPIDSAAIDRPAADEQLITVNSDLAASLKASSSPVSLVVNSPQSTSTASLVNATPEIVSTTPPLRQTGQQNHESHLAQLVLNKSFTWVTDARGYLTAKLDDHCSNTLFSSINQTKTKVFRDTGEPRVVTKNQPPFTLTPNQNAHSQAMQSLVRDYEQDYAITSEKRIRKQITLARQAVDSVLQVES